MNQGFHRLAAFATIVTLCVIVLGAWVRLSHAGLGCPDWPGCYGQLTWPDAPAEITQANQAFPDRPVETGKAWREMVHRYLAGGLMLLVLALNWLAWRRPNAARFRALSGLLLGLIIFQALLGMWTVTLKLLPVIVMGHLLGGMATLSLLTWLTARSRKLPAGASAKPNQGLRNGILVGLAVLSVQIALGGWTTANYAALSCPDLPTCGGVWWPETNFTEAFVLWREVGVDYEGGILDQQARATIHLMHRIGAIITLFVLLNLAIKMIRSRAMDRLGLLLATGVCFQFVLGVLNVLLKLPLANAVAHNGLAAVLLALLIWSLSETRKGVPA
jgi:cytochrome c oxidase assembly protein subunit 15